MAKSTKKSTRKFEKNHLKDTIERRKAGAKIKQRQQVKAKRQARNAKNAEIDDNAKTNESNERPAASKKSTKDDALGKMSVDDFFQGGFEIPKMLETKSSRKSIPENLGKRKRSAVEEEESDDDDSSQDSEGDAPVLSESDEEDDEEQETGMDQDAMDALAENDPEFYKYLKENDPEALNFDANAKFLDDSDGSDEKPTLKKKKGKPAKADAPRPTEDDSDDDNENDDEAEETDVSEVTSAMLSKWKAAITTEHSLRAMRQVVLAFRAAAHVNEDDGKSYKYSISSPEIYHDLLIVALKQIPDVLAHHLPVQETAGGKLRVPTNSKKFKSLSPLLRSHITAIQHLLTNLSDESTLKLTLSSITPLLPYLLSFKKVLKLVVTSVTNVWSDSSSTESTRITAFLVLRRLTIISDDGIREAVLKTVYQSLIKGSRVTTIHTIQGINLMKNSSAELWGLVSDVGYTTGFTSIRQLAIHLRGSITNNSKESYKTVYNWQYIHSLDFWSCVLSEHCSPLKEAVEGKESVLRPLIYPLVQVTLGAMRLIPTATYFPLRFHLIRSLLRLSRATGTYIPLASVLLEVLSTAEMKKPPKPSTLKGLDFSTNYKAPKSYLRTRVYQDGVGEQVTELLSEFFVLWSTNIAFPELALPVIVMLKRWLKDVGNKSTGNKNGKINSALLLLVQKLDASGKWIEERRTKVDFAPNNRTGVDMFSKSLDWSKTPLGAYVAGQRRQREEKAQLLEAGRREEERKRDLEKKEKSEAMDIDSEEEEEDEEENVEDDDDEEMDG